MIDTTNFNIWLTYSVDNLAIESKLLLHHEEILMALNALKLSDYSDVISELIVIADAENKTEKKERIVWRKAKRKIEIYMPLDYQSLLEAEDKQVLAMIAKVYLAAVKQFLTKRKDFKADIFYTDIENVFKLRIEN